MRFTKEHYERAIDYLKNGMEQLEPDGRCCSVCGDSGHMAFECGFNPLVAMVMCRSIAEESEVLHQMLHRLAGWDQAFGVMLGPKRIIAPEPETEERESP